MQKCKCSSSWDSEDAVTEICEEYVPDEGAFGLDNFPVCKTCSHDLSCHAQNEPINLLDDGIVSTIETFTPVCEHSSGVCFCDTDANILLDDAVVLIKRMVSMIETFTPVCEHSSGVCFCDTDENILLADAAEFLQTVEMAKEAENDSN